MAPKIPLRNYILLFICGWLLINFFPGSYNVDSWYQYHEMANKSYDDWHSPYFAYVWKLLFIVTHTFFSMYVLQMLGYFIFYYYLVKLVRNKWVLVLALASCVFLIFIPQYIMKDVHLTLAWAGAFLILLYPKESQTRYAKHLAKMLVLYGTFLRPNTVPALLPFFYIYIERYSEKTFSILVKALFTLAFTVVLLGSYYVLTYPVLNTKHAYPEYKLKLMDVMGITKLSGQNYMPDCITTSSLISYDEKLIMGMYSPATIDHIYWPSDTTVYLPPPTTELNACVSQAWKKAIGDHPSLYLKNRIEGFLYYLKIKKRFETKDYWNVTIAVARNPAICIDDEHTPFTKKWKCFGQKWIFSAFMIPGRGFC